MTQLSGTQERIWLDRYVRRDEQGNPTESNIDETFRRVADAIANDVWEADAFYDILRDFRFVPGGRILAGAGAEAEKTFYNCYVIPLETSARRHNRTLEENDWVEPGAAREDKGSDSRESIFNTIETMVGIMSRGGGVGINWSVLRPEKSYLKTVSGHSSGPVGWMNVASAAVGEVEQGGSRRGAAMFMLDDWHPDLMRFIDEKRDPKKITNANVSVAVSDLFMEAVRKDADWTFKFPDTTHPDYDSEWDGDLVKWESLGRPVVVGETVPAQQIWRRLGEAAHASGEPGVVFLGRYNAQSTGADVERLICVNPCGEQGLGAYSVCNLGSLNLYAFVNPASDSGERSFDGTALYDAARCAVRFLDNVIDKSSYFLPETESQQKRLRRIGLGTMGLADTLVALGIRYGSDEAVQFTEMVYRTIKDAAIEESMELARSNGPAPAWRDDMWNRPFLAEYANRTQNPQEPLRNIFLLTQAPTGTTSLLAGVNSGIEPYFALKTYRQDRTGNHEVYANAVQDVIVEGEPLPDYVVVANDVSVEDHIRMQAAVQRYVDSSVSKTINAPKDQTVEETMKAYDLAYDIGLKGLAYYRDGSRSLQVLYSSDPNERIAQLEAEVAELTAKMNSPFRKAQMESGPFRPVFDQTAESETTIWANRSGGCPDCGGEIVYEEGCMKCHSCGWSAC
jgi:ribonucleoside-diphosphate reductase alpha chain